MKALVPSTASVLTSGRIVVLLALTLVGFCTSARRPSLARCTASRNPSRRARRPAVAGEDACAPLDHVRRGGPAAEVGPHFFAALLLEDLELRLGLDAFGGDAEVEAVGHADDGGDDGAVAGAGFDFVDEGLVDFDAVDREAAQVVQR